MSLNPLRNILSRRGLMVAYLSSRERVGLNGLPFFPLSLSISSSCLCSLPNQSLDRRIDRREFVDGQTIGQLTCEFVDGQTIGQLTGEFVDGQTIGQLTCEFVDGQTSLRYYHYESLTSGCVKDVICYESCVFLLLP